MERGLCSYTIADFWLFQALPERRPADEDASDATGTSSNLEGPALFDSSIGQGVGRAKM